MINIQTATTEQLAKRYKEIETTATPKELEAIENELDGGGYI